MALTLEVPEIPEVFRKSLPAGMKIVRRGERDLLVVEQLFCRHGCNLVTPTVKIHGQNAVCFSIRAGGAQGLVFVDAFWGGHKKLFDFMFAGSERDPVVDAFCPHCKVLLSVEGRCQRPECSSERKIEFYLADASNRILTCARWGCPEHELLVSSLPMEVLENVSRTNFFGEGEEAVLGEL
ncbi:MAG: hypothetical protein AB1714_23475 [Acidobacteriota bacterium]